MSQGKERPEKRQKVEEGAPFYAEFNDYTKQLDEQNERRERLVKASRDVTIQSKKVIFQIHRLPNSQPERNAALDRADQDLAAVRKNHLARVARELDQVSYWKLGRAYSPGVQEYVEAATLVEFVRTGQLLSLSKVNAVLADLLTADGQPFELTLADYLLGVTDLSGELMRKAITNVASGQGESATTIRSFVSAMFKGYYMLPKLGDQFRELPKKLEVMRQSLIKIENASYTVHVRGSEYPEHLLAGRLQEVPRDDTGQDDPL